MTTHEFDAYIDAQPHAEPDYHEPCLVMQEFEESENNALIFCGDVKGGTT